MSYRWVPHTAELELELEAPTEAGIYADALRAIAELLGGSELLGGAVGEGAPRTVEVALAHADRAVLLTEWIEELVYMAETQDLVPVEVVALTIDGDRLSATVRGRVGQPPHIVKGATLHRLEFTEAGGGGFRARVVLDV